MYDPVEDRVDTLLYQCPKTGAGIDDLSLVVDHKPARDRFADINFSDFIADPPNLGNLVCVACGNCAIRQTALGAVAEGEILVAHSLEELRELEA